MIESAERQRLLQLARGAIVAYLSGLPAPAVAPSPITERRAGVFVSLHKGDALRGCIGHIEPDHPLSRAIPSAAIAAASTDPRFAPVTADELIGLQIELSILGPLEQIAGVGDIEVGRHGLVVESGWKRGLLLPQVAVEWGWVAEVFLSQACHKAGLPADAWKSAATLWRFEAEVFSEPPSGPAGYSGS
jgi:AmmeMemoRadiSam system protein A